jgi:hypothetical protein
MDKKQYPLIGIFPEHCHIFKKGCDGAYIVRRKVRSDDRGNFVILEDQHVAVKKVSERDETRDETTYVTWETYYAGR